MSGLAGMPSGTPESVSDGLGLPRVWLTPTCKAAASLGGCRHAEAVSERVPRERCRGGSLGRKGSRRSRKDFGIAESCLGNWLSAADAEDGKRGGPKAQEAEQLQELKRRNRLLEQNEVRSPAARHPRRRRR
jgi:hypothetical protein